MYQFEELEQMEEVEEMEKLEKLEAELDIKSDQLESELVIRLKVKVAKQLEGFVGTMQV